MFICKECLKEHFKNGEGLFQSIGICELCKTQQMCSDISSSLLKRKDGDPVIQKELNDFWKQEIEKCKASPYYFFTNYLQIKNPNGTVSKFQTPFDQLEFDAQMHKFLHMAKEGKKLIKIKRKHS